jgi:glycosyltransferase involved in cell wall biosynthesis
MKIAILCNLPPPSGGAEIFAKQLALNLIHHGQGVFIITHERFEVRLCDNLVSLHYPFDWSSQSDFIHHHIPIYPAFKKVLSYDQLGKRDDSFDESFVTALREIFQREMPDLIHYHFTVGKFQEVLYTSQCTNIPLIVTCHGMIDFIPQFGAHTPDRMPAEETIRILSFSRCVVVVSREMVRYTQENSLPHVCCIPGGIDLTFFSPSNGSPREGILYVGKMNKNKGLKQAIIAYLKIVQKINENLYLIGRGIDNRVFNKTSFYLNTEQRNQVMDLIQKGKIHFLGELSPDDLRDHYRKCRLLVLPSLSEGLPLVVLEALACGMPVVASDVGSISDVVHHGINGYLISPGDVDELATSILKFITVVDSESVRNACRNSVRGYDIKLISKRYVQLFESFLAREQRHIVSWCHT